METLRNLKEIFTEATERFNQYDGKDFILPQTFKEQVHEINSSKVTYNQYSAIIETRGNQNGFLNIFLPNQWFYIASYFTDFYNELQKYKKEALKVVSKERLKVLNGSSLINEEYSRLANLDMDDTSKNFLVTFITDYSWWSGAKTIDRGDFYVSPILTCAKLVNSSQSFVTDLCAFLADKKELVDAIISGEENASTNNSISKALDSYQQIFYGAPGTGKSNTIKREVDDKNKINCRVTFHPDSDYSTFVGCYKPKTSKESQQAILDYDSLVDKFKKYISDLGNITHASAAIGYNYHDSIVRMLESGNHTIAQLLADAHKSGTTYDTTIRSGMLLFEEQQQMGNTKKQITYEFVPQAFTKAYTTAWNTKEDVFLIIEEINRGNCAQIFGDLFQLLDRKDGISEYPVDADSDLADHIKEALKDSPRTDIPDEIKSGKKLKLPSNLYIWATMNTSDQSLFPIDSAFKRRWDWKYIPIKNHEDENYRIEIDGATYNWWGFLEKINSVIGETTSSEDKKLGYFFVKAEDKVIREDKFVSKVLFYLWNDVFKNYGFDNPIFSKGDNLKFTFSDFFKKDGSPDTDMVKEFLKRLDETIDKEHSFVSTEDTNDAPSSALIVKYNGEVIEGTSARSKYIEIVKRTIEEKGGDQVSNCISADLVQTPPDNTTRNFTLIGDSGWHLATNIGIDAMKRNLKKIKEQLGVDIVIE